MKFLLVQKIILWMLIVTFSFPVQWAKAQESNDAGEALLKQALIGAAKEAATPYLKSKINEFIFMKAGATAATPNGAGTTILAIVDIGMAANDFNNAETDKGKFYAGARAVNGVVTIAAPPVGAVVGIALFAAGLADSVFDGIAAEESMRLQKIILEHQRGINNIILTFTQADIARLSTTLTLLTEAKESYKKINHDILERCTHEADIHTSEILSFCVGRVVQIAAVLNTIVRLSEYLVDVQTLALDKEKYLAESKIVVENYRKEIEQVKAKAKLAEDRINTFLAGFSKMLFEEAIKTAEYEGLPDIKESFFDACYTKSLNLLRKGALIDHYSEEISQDTAALLGKLDRSTFQQELRFFFAEPCLTDANHEQKLYPRLAKNIKRLKAYPQ